MANQGTDVKGDGMVKPPAGAGDRPSPDAASSAPPANAGARAHPETATRAAPKGDPLPAFVKREAAEIVAKWIDDAVAVAPPPEKVHVTTHLKSCIPALLLALK